MAVTPLRLAWAVKDTTKRTAGHGKGRLQVTPLAATRAVTTANDHARLRRLLAHGPHTPAVPWASSLLVWQAGTPHSHGVHKAQKRVSTADRRDDSRTSGRITTCHVGHATHAAPVTEGGTFCPVTCIGCTTTPCVFTCDGGVPGLPAGCPHRAARHALHHVQGAQSVSHAAAHVRGAGRLLRPHAAQGLVVCRTGGNVAAGQAGQAA